MNNSFEIVYTGGKLYLVVYLYVQAMKYKYTTRVKEIQIVYVFIYLIGPEKDTSFTSEVKYDIIFYSRLKLFLSNYTWLLIVQSLYTSC